MTQAELASSMKELGLDWSAGTVGFVERYERAVTVDEYVGLALCFDVAVGALLDPTGPLGADRAGLDLAGLDGTGVEFISWRNAHQWARGKWCIHYKDAQLWTYDSDVPEDVLEARDQKGKGLSR